MAYQFARIHAYSQSGSTRNSNPKTTAGCLGEAFRNEGMASHVKTPKKPEILLGSREEIDLAIKNYRENFKDSRGHKLRKDGKELLAGVVSWPPGTSKNFFNDSLNVVKFFIMNKYGSSLKCVVSHEDEPYLDEKGKHHGETHYHIHFFVVPKSHENFRDYHEGIYAKWQARKEGLNHWKQDIRYKRSMGDWQEKFYREVGIHLGWKKERPKKLKEKRLSNREYKIIKDAKEKSVQIQNDAKIEAEKIISDSKEQAEIVLQNANKKYDEVIMLEKQILINKAEQEEIKKSLQEREANVKYQENFNKSAEKAISDMKKKLPAEIQLAVPIFSTLNAENLNGKEKITFFKMFFTEIVEFVNNIIKRIREIPEQDKQKENLINNNKNKTKKNSNKSGTGR